MSILLIKEPKTTGESIAVGELSVFSSRIVLAERLHLPLMSHLEEKDRR